MKQEQLVELAKEYGTPLYIYDGNIILQRYKELFNFIKWPKLEIFYAMKANYNIGILRLLKDADAKVDIVSPAEAILCLEIGFSPENLLFTANNITEKEMHEVHKLGLLFNIGSLSRLEKYGKAFPGSKVCIRFNPDVVAGSHVNIQTGGNITKFGILMQDVQEVKKIIQSYNLTVVGLHEHTGSGIAETEKVYQSMTNLLSIAKAENFPDLEFIDFGGGLKVPYHPDERRIDYLKFGEIISEIFSDFCKNYGKKLVLRFEPGKYIVTESGYLIVQVNTFKNNRGRLIVGTNSGFPQLIRPSFYNAYHHIANLTNPDGEMQKYDICGNICETGDVFASQRDLPEVRIGDYLVLENAGAYCYSMGGIYNLRAMPSEVLFYKGKAHLIRKQLTNEELVKQILQDSS